MLLLLYHSYVVSDDAPQMILIDIPYLHPHPHPTQFDMD